MLTLHDVGGGVGGIVGSVVAGELLEMADIGKHPAKIQNEGRPDVNNWLFLRCSECQQRGICRMDVKKRAMHTKFSAHNTGEASYLKAISLALFHRSEASFKAKKTGKQEAWR
jgi:hypothetical protein